MRENSGSGVFFCGASVTICSPTLSQLWPQETKGRVMLLFLPMPSFCTKRQQQESGIVSLWNNGRVYTRETGVQWGKFEEPMHFLTLLFGWNPEHEPLHCPVSRAYMYSERVVGCLTLAFPIHTLLFLEQPAGSLLQPS